MTIPGFTGAVLAPDDSRYDRHRKVWNAMVDRRPALIARTADRSDVVAAVRFARQRGLDLAVHCGGHSVLGMSVPEGGLMLDLTPLAAVRVDPDRRRAWVQGGALLGALDRATQPFGLATTAGNVSHTGVGGLTLGGGMGWLARGYGLTCDNVVSFEVVTAEGELVRASAAENADLFWALRGGGGNFGVVTSFEFQLHPVGTAALVTELFYRPADAGGAMRRWRDLLPGAPPEATFTAWAGTAGAEPYLPPDLHHNDLVSLGYVWVGDPENGRGLLDAVRAAVPPAAQRARDLSYLELQTMEDTPEGHHWRRYWKGHYLRDLPDAAVDAFIGRGVDEGADLGLVPGASLQAYGGAIRDVADHETAFGHRQAMVEFVASARWADPGEDAPRMEAARRYAKAIEPFASGVYVNVLGDDGESGLRRAYGPDKLRRLGALKGRYDPDNVFRHNHNIRPDGSNPS
jgi:FAD/FMN-containing dehydrogenase